MYNLILTTNILRILREKKISKAELADKAARRPRHHRPARIAGGVGVGATRVNFCSERWPHSRR